MAGHHCVLLMKDRAFLPPSAWETLLWKATVYPRLQISTFYQAGRRKGTAP